MVRWLTRLAPATFGATRPVVGWLVFERFEIDPDALEPQCEQPPHRPRLVVAGVVMGRATGDVEPVLDHDDFWLLLAPGDPLPDYH